MARRPNRRQQATVLAAIRMFWSLPASARITIVVLAVVAVVAYRLYYRPAPAAPPVVTTGLNADGTGDFLFCTWNVENLFDDRDDDRRTVDETYDGPFATDPALREAKYDQICKALLGMNGGKGPDVIASVEVEGVRAGELLRDALNARLTDPDLHYKYLAVRDLDGGRHITPCVVSRLPVIDADTQMPASRLRILRTRLTVNGYDLWVITSHWTSQLRQRDGDNGEDGRANYAAAITSSADELYRRSPATDLVVCGDFNDTPEADAVVHGLRATGVRAAVAPPTDPPRLLDLMAGKSASQFGTLWYRGDPLIYDHICVSAGMLDDRGWSCDPDSVQTVRAGLVRPGASRPEPWRFGTPDPAVPLTDRGYSDHFPVIVRLRVAAPPAQ